MAEEVFLDIEDVLTTLGATPSSRNFKEGQALLNARHVILCAASQKSTTDIYIFALCLQTTAINCEPHEITGHIKLGKALLISNLLCSCKAGAGGKCKHISTMLLYCTRNNIMQLEVVSSTDKKCLWKEKKVPVVDQYQAMPLLNTNCFQQLKIKAKEPCPNLSDLNYEAVLSTFLEACPNSALALHRLGRSNPEHTKEVETVDSCCFDVTLTEPAATTEIIRNIFLQENLWMDYVEGLNLEPLHDCCKDTYSKHLICVDPLQLCMRTKYEKVLWHKERQFRITGSRCYGIYTYGKIQQKLIGMKSQENIFGQKKLNQHLPWNMD